MKRIVYEMHEQGLTQTALANASKCNRVSICRIINGVEPPYPKRGQRIADALGWKGSWQDLFEEIELV